MHFWYNFFMEKLAASRDVAEIKLLILYILDKLGMPVGNIELTKYMLEERLMGFITFQQRVNELIASNHILKDMDGGGAHYVITPSGKDPLSEMSDLIPNTEKNRVDRTIRRFSGETKNTRSINADYTPDDEHSGIVRIEMNEGDLALINLEIAAASKEEARIICNNWKTHTAEIYAGIVDLLLDPVKGGAAAPAHGEGASGEDADAGEGASGEAPAHGEGASGEDADAGEGASGEDAGAGEN
jgi:hypothetical protein